MQAERNTARRHGGTGLGLAICKMLAELMGGKIWIESAGKGRGSTFAFTVNLPEGAEMPADDVSEAAGIFAGLAVLLADDTELNREVAAALLEPTGVKIDAVANGAEAVEKF
jgi:hypothetical protein